MRWRAAGFIRCVSSTISSRERTRYLPISAISPQMSRAQRMPVDRDNPFVEFERLCADAIERAWDLYRDIRDAGIELAFHSLYGTPWMKRLGAARHARPQSHDFSRFPHVQQAIKKAKLGGYAEGIVRMLVLLARARRSVRRDRLERSDRLLHARPPFNSMTVEMRSHMIHEQSVIVDFCGNDAVTSLADLLKDPVDRYRALNLVLDVAGPVEQSDRRDVQAFPGCAANAGARMA
jgi:hypothetical protein